MSDCILYNVVSEIHSLHIPAVEEEGVLAYCDLMLFELSLL